MALRLEGSEGATRHEWRMWLWPTSSADSSRRTGKRAVRTDTLTTPLFGTFVTDTTLRAASEATVRAEVDPVYPPILVYDLAGRATRKPRDRSLLMMFGPDGNRRDGITVYDGGGSAFWIRGASSSALSGTVLPAGIVMTDTGYFCATRVRP